MGDSVDWGALWEPKQYTTLKVKTPEATTEKNPDSCRRPRLRSCSRSTSTFRTVLISLAGSSNGWSLDIWQWVLPQESKILWHFAGLRHQGERSEAYTAPWQGHEHEIIPNAMVAFCAELGRSLPYTPVIELPDLVQVNAR